MATVASVRPEKQSTASAVRRQLSEAAAQELASLRTALDQKLAALEAALASPSQNASLETLVIDLARVATAEAETAAAKACLDVQLEAQRQAAARTEAQRALETERERVAGLQRDLDHARTALKSQREIAMALREDLTAAADALKGEREAAGRLRTRCEEAEGKHDAERMTAAALRRDVEEARTSLQAAQQAGIELSQSVEPAHSALAKEHEANVRLTETLGALQAELAAAKQLAQQRGGDLEAVQARIDGLEQHRRDLERARDEHDSRATAAGRERDALAGELAALREKAEREQSLAGLRSRELDDARTAHEQAMNDLHGRLQAAASERDSLAAELAAARNTIAAVDAQAEERGRQAAHDRAEAERVLHETSARLDAALRDRDALAVELESLRQAAQEARSETGTPADDERRRLERTLAETEARAAAAVRDRDMMAEELEVMRESLAAVQNDAQTRVADAQQAAAGRIAELEAVLQDRARQSSDRGTEPPTIAARRAHAIRLHDAVFAEPTLASKPEPAARPEPGADTAAAAPPGGPVRRASRHAFRDEVPVLIDGSPATLVDLSIAGAQLLSHAALKPNRMVRVQLPGEDNPIICKGKVVWARLEAGPTSGLRYRAGVFFTGVEERAVEKFLAQHACDK